MNRKGVAAFALAMGAAAASHAAYYYVDADNGNNASSGIQETDGVIYPWKTLARVNAATLQPGDAVLLKRGRVWQNETLVLRSGVHFMPYGSGSVLPVIKGSVPVGSLTWQAEGGQIYSASVAGLGLSRLSRLYLDGTTLQRARHPNAGGGSYPVANSRYFRMASSPGGTQFTPLAADLPAGADLAGAQLTVRGLDWVTQSYQVTAHNLTTAVVTAVRNAGYPTDWNFHFAAGMGYRLENKLWMLDQPGEWVLDETAGKLYVRLPDGSSPAGKNLAASVRNGITANGASGFILQDIAVQETAGDAVNLEGVSNFQVTGLQIHGSTGTGISAFRSHDGSIVNSVIDEVSREGISASDMSQPEGELGYGSLDLTISDNKLTNIGRDDLAFGAIRPGRRNTITNNVVENVGSVGISVSRDSTVSGNVIKGACMDLGDCGAIAMIGRAVEPGFAAGSPLNVIVSGNIIDGVPGSVDGMTDTLSRRRDTNGIYLDFMTNDVEVTGNLVTGAGLGLNMSTTKDVLVTDNAFVGNWEAQVKLQKLKLTAPFTPQGNQFQYNILATSDEAIGLHLRSENGGHVEDYATYVGNKYLADASRFPFRIEDDYGEHRQLTFSQWLAFPNSPDSAGSHEIHGKVAVNAPGSSVLFSDNFDGGGDLAWYWGSYWGIDFFWVSGAGCPTGGSGKCVEIRPNLVPSWDSGKRAGLIRKQSVTFVPGKRYRVTFDARVDTGSGQLLLSVFRGQDAPISNIGGAELTTSWQRFERILTTDETITSQTWLQMSFLVPNGTRVQLDNVSAQEVVYQQPASSPIVALYNAGSTTLSENCPSAKLTATCSSYVDAKTGAAPGFPLSIPPRGWKILTVPTAVSRDADADGVPASADQCLSTPANAGVISTGCAVVY